MPVDSVEEYFDHFRVLEIDYTFYRPLTELDGTPTQNYQRRITSLNGRKKSERKDNETKSLSRSRQSKEERDSATLADQVSKGAKSAGANVETIFLQGLKIAPCKSCYACQKSNSKGCATKDDMQSVYLKLIKADAWIISSPVYWFTMSAQTKIFMDRCFALPAYAKDPFLGKRIAIAMSYGDMDPFISGCVNALRSFQDAFRYTGSEIVGMVYGSAMKAGEIKLNETLMQEAEDLGKRLVKK